MARTSQITRATLAPLIGARGPISSTELAALLRTNRSTITRAVASMGDEIVALGATRSTRYVLRRQIATAGNRWPIYQIDETGKSQQWTELEAFHDRQWRVTWHGTEPAWASRFMSRDGLWQGFPFFLSDLRPQGFLGRAIASQVSRLLPLPDDPRHWGDEDTLLYLQAVGEDLLGNLVIGENCLRRTLAQEGSEAKNHVVEIADCANRYPEIARSAITLLHGSSAGGEQPKFIATLRDISGIEQSVIVKFSPPFQQEVGRRWADLLLCEFHAHEVLAQHGLALPGARLVDTEERRFLEVPRFDRVGARGRCGVVSLEALHAAAAGDRRSNQWLSAANDLQRLEWVDEPTVKTIQQLYAFGEWIGNSDRHFGNLSFLLTDELPLRVTPSYDMLPMLWAPGAHGEITQRSLAPARPKPAEQEAWSVTREWALDFWQRVRDDTRVSKNFRKIALDAIKITIQAK